MTVTATKPVSLIILGGGQRGVIYASYALRHPERATVVAVADPREQRRKIFARQHK
jgi:pimeloyl-ACP methyl ester carboxylesterase